MVIMIESTNEITQIDGVPVRVWLGTTDRGIKCKLFIHRIAVHKQSDHEEFDFVLRTELPLFQSVPLAKILP